MSVTSGRAGYYNEELPLEFNGITYYIEVKAEAQYLDDTGSWDDPPSSDFEITDVKATWFIKDNKGELIEVKSTKEMEYYLEEFLYDNSDDWEFYGQDYDYDYDYDDYEYRY